MSQRGSARWWAWTTHCICRQPKALETWSHTQTQHVHTGSVYPHSVSPLTPPHPTSLLESSSTCVGWHLTRGEGERGWGRKPGATMWKVKLEGFFFFLGGVGVGIGPLDGSICTQHLFHGQPFDNPMPTPLSTPGSELGHHPMPPGLTVGDS